MKYNYSNRMESLKPSIVKDLLKYGSDPNILSFGGGYPDESLFPIEAIQKVVSKTISEEKRII